MAEVRLVPYLLGPDHSHRRRSDCRGDNDTHEQIQVSHADTNVVEHGGESSHEERERGHRDVVDTHELLPCRSRVDISLVDVVSRNGRYRDELR